MVRIHLFLVTNHASPEPVTICAAADLLGTGKYIYLFQNSVSLLKFDFEEKVFLL